MIHCGLGRGRPVEGRTSGTGPDHGRKTPLTLVSAKTFTTGVVVLSYRTAGA
jgi:hypothetical protein